MNQWYFFFVFLILLKHLKYTVGIMKTTRGKQSG